MKVFIKEFLKRGFVSAWGGPFVLAIIYFIVGKIENIENTVKSEPDYLVVTHMEPDHSANIFNFFKLN